MIWAINSLKKNINLSTCRLHIRKRLVGFYYADLGLELGLGGVGVGVIIEIGIRVEES